MTVIYHGAGASGSTTMPDVWVRQALPFDTLLSEEVQWLERAGFVVARHSHGDLIRADTHPCGDLHVPEPAKTRARLGATFYRADECPLWAREILEEIVRGLPADDPGRLDRMVLRRPRPVESFVAPVLQGVIQRTHRTGWPINAIEIVINTPGGETSVRVTRSRITTCRSGEGPLAKSMLTHLVGELDDRDDIPADIAELTRKIQAY